MERVAFLHKIGGMTAAAARAEIGGSQRLLGAMRKRAAGGAATKLTAGFSPKEASSEVKRLEKRNKKLRAAIGGGAARAAGEAGTRTGARA